MKIQRNNKLTAVQKLVNLRNSFLQDIDDLSEFELVQECNFFGINWCNLTHDGRREMLKKIIRGKFKVVKDL